MERRKRERGKREPWAGGHGVGLGAVRNAGAGLHSRVGRGEGRLHEGAGCIGVKRCIHVCQRSERMGVGLLVAALAVMLYLSLLDSVCTK